VGIKQTRQGRRAEFEYDCRYCGKECGTKGVLKKHWNETHHHNRAYAKYNKESKYDKCLVKDCEYETKGERANLRRHL